MDHEHDGSVTLKFTRQESDLPPLQLERAPQNFRACQHKSSIIDRDARRIHCKDCGAELDPYEVLSRLAMHSEAVDARVKEIREFNRIQQETAERIANEKRTGIPAKVAKLHRGDKVHVEHNGPPGGGGTLRGYVKSIDAECVEIAWEMSRDSGRKIPVDTIIDVRVIRRAETPVVGRY